VTTMSSPTALPPALVTRHVTATEVAEMRERLRAFEERYGVSSDTMTDASEFRDAHGNFIETDALMEWSSLYARYLARTGR